MLSEKDKEQLGNMMRTSWIIWAAMFGSLAVYIGVCHALADGMKVFTIKDFPLTVARIVFLVLSALLCIISGNIRKLQLHPKSIAQRIARTGKTGFDPKFILEKYMSVMIISLVLADIIGIFGIGIFFLSGDFSSLYLLIGISAVTMLIFRPKYKEVEKIAEEISSSKSDSSGRKRK